MNTENELINDEIVLFELKRIFSYKSKIKENSEIIERGFVCSQIKKGKVLFVGINPSYPIGSKDTEFSESWSYIDLFQFRETDQKKVAGFAKNDPQFLVSQLRLTHKIICEINPKLIIVCNSGASDFFGINKWKNTKGWLNVWLGYDFEFDKDLGVDIIKSKNENSILPKENEFLFETPVLFTSTLTYIAKFDKRRLNWQINRIAKSLNFKK